MKPQYRKVENNNDKQLNLCVLNKVVKIQQESIRELREQMKGLQDELKRINTDIKQLKELDSKGYVYRRKKKDYTKEELSNLTTSTTLFLQVYNQRHTPITDFKFQWNMRMKPRMSKGEFQNTERRKTYLLNLAKYLNDIHIQEFGRSSPRTKSVLKRYELCKGFSTTGCLFPINYKQHTEEYMSQHPEYQDLVQVI